MESRQEISSLIFQRASWKKVSFNTFASQLLICLPIVGGGVFSTLLAERGHSVPMLQLALLYLFLCIWLSKYFFETMSLTFKDIVFLSITGILDCHANFLIVKAYSYTTITSVMILMVFTVPSAVFLSVLFLRIKYCWLHYASCVLSICSVIIVIICDIYEYEHNDDINRMSIIFGDLFCIIGVFFLASTNVYQEWLIGKNYQISEILAFQAPIGVVFAILEGWLIGEFTDIFSTSPQDIVPCILFLLGFALVNFILYNFIPYFISMAGATLMNIGNLTASVYSMLFDIFLFNGNFKWFYLIGFLFQITSIFLFSLKDPICKENASQEPSKAPKYTELKSKEELVQPMLL
ncbi:unnamed protein product [Moneuplotes crassus]|uniref:Uncharacterized protein n=1 Tax=Euplotes crassus TaxID=5936 RepID=A0AAD1UMY8_EUPCR|nr:unnamed protein product [Moneuplotes crassus]